VSSKHAVNTKFTTMFYTMVALCLGFFRIPGIFLYLEIARGTPITEWSTILALIFLPLEGFAVVTAYSWYFSLFRRMRKYLCKTEQEDTLSGSTIAKDLQPSSGEQNAVDLGNEETEHSIDQE